MAINQKNIKPGQQDDFLRIQDLLYLCLARWKWFVLSLAITVGAATVHLLRTLPFIHVPLRYWSKKIPKVSRFPRIWNPSRSSGCSNPVQM